MNNESGKLIIAVGILIVIIGIVWYFFADKLSFIGR